VRAQANSRMRMMMSSRVPSPMYTSLLLVR
jgi:hypothetical protein